MACKLSWYATTSSAARSGPSDPRPPRTTSRVAVTVRSSRERPSFRASRETDWVTSVPAGRAELPLLAATSAIGSVSSRPSNMGSVPARKSSSARNATSLTTNRRWTCPCRDRRSGRGAWTPQDARAGSSNAPQPSCGRSSVCAARGRGTVSCSPPRASSRLAAKCRAGSASTVGQGASACARAEVERQRHAPAGSRAVCHPCGGYGASGTTTIGASSTGSFAVSKTAVDTRRTWLACFSRKASAVSRNPMRGVR